MLSNQDPLQKYNSDFLLFFLTLFLEVESNLHNKVALG